MEYLFIKSQISVRRYDGVTVRRRCNGAKVQRFNGKTTQRLNVSYNRIIEPFFLPSNRRTVRPSNRFPYRRTVKPLYRFPYRQTIVLLTVVPSDRWTVFLTVEPLNRFPYRRTFEPSNHRTVFLTVKPLCSLLSYIIQSFTGMMLITPVSHLMVFLSLYERIVDLLTDNSFIAVSRAAISRLYVTGSERS